MIRKILIVDDHVSFISGFSKALKRHCHFPGEVMAVENGERAIDEVSSCFYDICFLDINLPDINGLDVMKRIHDITPSTRVVIMSAAFIDKNMNIKIEESASLFIPKPIELDTVCDYINKESKNIEYYYGHTNNNGHNYKENKRQHARRPCKRTICCSVSVFYNWELKSRLEVRTKDISNGGVGIKVRYPLNLGNVLRFQNRLENKSGIVKWTMGSGENCRAGIKFI